MTVAQERVREFLTDLPRAAYPMSNRMLAYLAEMQDVPAEGVALLSRRLPDGHYKSPKHVLQSIGRKSEQRAPARASR